MVRTTKEHSKILKQESSVVGCFSENYLRRNHDTVTGCNSLQSMVSTVSDTFFTPVPQTDDNHRASHTLFFSKENLESRDFP